MKLASSDEASSPHDMNVKTRRLSPVPHGRPSNRALVIAVIVAALAALALPGL
jgi:hypothetical protein